MGVFFALDCLFYTADQGMHSIKMDIIKTANNSKSIASNKDKL